MSLSTAAKLGVNIDHIATLRQLRGTPYPNILEAARLVEIAGADQITVHLREDRRHIQDEDVKILRSELKITLNLEMAATDAMIKFATRIRPDWVCLVPEKRQELTTEGGLDVAKNQKRVADCVRRLHKAGIKVSLFVEPSTESAKMSHALGADAIEIHTGRYCLATQGGMGGKSSAAASRELERIRKAGLLARKSGMFAHAGHGFDYDNVRDVAEMTAPEGGQLIQEFNIGHAIICRAALVGLERAVREMISAVVAP